MRVAMVFDDGPTPERSEKFLALFAKEKVRVTFSYVGKNVAAHPTLARAATESQHEINNHSFTHPHLTRLDPDVLLIELRDTQDAIMNATGRAPRWFWPPFLEMTDRVAVAVAATDIKPFPWEKYHFISTEDWNTATDAATIVRRATTDIRDQTVILFHEWRTETLAQMPAIIAELKRQRFEFLTLSEMATTLPA